MDDAYLVSLTASAAGLVKATDVQLRHVSRVDQGESLSGSHLVIGDRKYRLRQVDKQLNLEVWKSLDGVHSLKSGDLHQLIAEGDRKAAGFDGSTFRKAQVCELADTTATRYTRVVEADALHLATPAASTRPTVLTEYVAQIADTLEPR